MKRYGRQSGAAGIAAFVFAAMLGSISARASVAALVEEPYGSIVGMAPTGHVAVYLDHVCADSPTKLRVCREGELGVVVSRYNDVGGYDWLAIPLVDYLYAVDSVDEIPATMDAATEVRMREEYRRKYLTGIVPDRADGSAPEGNWYQLVGSAYDRTLYGFQVKSTAEQDARLIALFNDRKNKERYNGAFTNCADFARVTINRFYPHAVRRNFVADLGMTTPKQVGHALARYGDAHPEAELTMFRVPQVAGSLPRSKPIKGAVESLLTRKRYVLPITAMQPIATGVMVIAYMGSGRFSMPKNAPVLELRSLSVASSGIEVELPMPVGAVRVSFAEENAVVVGQD